jgi:membrane associated rhomboid family serine protease
MIPLQDDTPSARKAYVTISIIAACCLCGIVAVYTQALSDPHSAFPIIGASGAISGVLGAYLLLFPRAKVLTLVVLPFFLTTRRDTPLFAP